MEVADYVRSRLALGEWTHDQPLPHRTWFIKKFNTTHNTVQKAFDQLRDEGFIIAVPRLGTFSSSPLPFADRYLILFYGMPEKPNLLTRAIQQAAHALATRHGITFDFSYTLDLEYDDPGYIDVIDAVRSHRYTGVFLQAPPFRRRKDSILSVDNVPIAGFFAPHSIVTGSLVHPLTESGPITADLSPHFKECQKRGLKRIAVFEGFLTEAAREIEIRQQALAHGLECGPYHVHGADTCPLALPIARRIFRMALAPEFPWQPEAIVVGDDHFVPLIEDVLREHYGEDGLHRFFIAAHGNLPCLPKTDLPVVFHGLDIEKTLETWVTYAQACTQGHKRINPIPRLIRF